MQIILFDYWVRVNPSAQERQCYFKHLEQPVGHRSHLKSLFISELELQLRHLVTSLGSHEPVHPSIHFMHVPSFFKAYPLLHLVQVETISLKVQEAQPLPQEIEQAFVSSSIT